MLVYKVTSPSNKCYIGITSKTLEFRKTKHYTELKSHNTNYKFHNAIRKYGDALCWEVIDNSATSWEEVTTLEKYYIQLFDSFNTGYNMTLGGDGGWGYKHTEEAKAKMRGPKPKISAALKGKKKTEEHKKNLSNARKAMNIKLPEEQKKEISNFHKIRNSDINIRNQAALAGGGKSFLVFKDKQLIGEWISQRQCARDLELDQTHIGRCLKKLSKYKSHKGYTFVHKEEGVLS